MKIPNNIRNVAYLKHMRRNKMFENIRMQQNIYKVARKYALDIVNSQEDKDIPEPARYHSLTNLDADMFWSKQIQLTEVAEQRFEKKLNTFLEQLEEKAIQRLPQVVPKKVKKFELFNETQEVESAIDLFTPLQKQIAQLSASEAHQLLNVGSVYTPSEAMQRSIEVSVSKFAKSFVSTDKDKLSSILNSGLRDGQSIPQIASSIREEFGEFRKNQADKIARTETLRASNLGSLDAYKQSGVVEGKQWYTSQDERVCPECAPLDGKIINLGGDFFDDEFGGDPPLHPNCRCVILPVIEGGSTKERMLALEVKVKEQNRKLVESGQLIKELEELAYGEGEDRESETDSQE